MQNDITVVDRYTGQVLDLPPSQAKARITQGSAVETVPSDNAAAASWRAGMRANLIAEAKQRNLAGDIETFEQFEQWCTAQGLHALPFRVKDTIAWMLYLQGDGEPRYATTVRTYAIERMHRLTGHPPQQLARLVSDGLCRAIDFAKLEMKEVMGVVEDRESAAAMKALEMFSDGEIPKQFPAHV